LVTHEHESLTVDVDPFEQLSVGVRVASVDDWFLAIFEEKELRELLDIVLLD
jgi:hypothetical protein